MREYYLYMGQIQSWTGPFPTDNPCFQLGTTFEDSFRGKFVKLSDEQVTFMNEHPEITCINDIWNMQVIDRSIKLEGKYE